MPRPTGRQRQAASANTKGNEVQAEMRSILSSETATSDLWNSLQAANSRISELEKLLAEKDMECHKLQSALENCNQKLHKHQDSSALWKEKHEKTYHELRMQRQTTKRGKEKLTRLEEQLEVLKTAKKEASKQFLRGSSELSFQCLWPNGPHSSRVPMLSWLDHH
jgi:predicted  nucleic acid-binding Zn-ribbon protein